MASWGFSTRRNYLLDVTDNETQKAITSKLGSTIIVVSTGPPISNTTSFGKNFL